MDILELEIALGLQLPIIWVQVGSTEARAPLKVIPCGEPHLKLEHLRESTTSFPPEDVERIVHLAFDVHRRDSVDRLLDQLDSLKDLAGQQGFELREIDARRMLYSLHLPRRSARYSERPLTHLIQFFGRTPTRDDLSAFPECAKDGGFAPHPQHGHHYDSAILLAPIPTQSVPLLVADPGVHIDSISDYLTELQKPRNPAQEKQKFLLISGAFADAEPAFQQNMLQAVHAFAASALTRGFGVCFGAHPTFQFLLFDLARRLRPNDPVAALRMYVSEYFVTPGSLEELRKNATVYSTVAQGQSRAASLDLMRRSMIADPDNLALVAIGGKTKAGGHQPGVDDEIRLARNASLPVFLVGSVGGRSSELCSGDRIAEFDNLNSLTPGEKEEFTSSLDYHKLAQLLWLSLSV